MSGDMSECWWLNSGSYTLEQLQNKNHPNVTHMVITGNLPENLFELAPNITHLCIWNTDESAATKLWRIIGGLQNLEFLNLCSNKLKQLPESIRSLKQLRTLNVADNNLQTLPEWIGGLRNLRKLSLGFNNLTSLPESIGDLESLQELDAYKNKLETIPTSVGKLRNMLKINLGRNKLTVLPDSVCELTSLQHFKAHENNVANLPDRLGDLRNLKTLSLSGNQLASLPQSLQDLQSISSLDISNNEFLEIPPCLYHLRSLLHLDLKRNSKLQALNPDISSLKALKCLELDFCLSLVSPPHEVWSRGIESIRQYYQDLSKGVGHRISAATVAVLGKSLAGKTSLIRTLQRKKRVLTTRTSDWETDESTRVFNVEEVVTPGTTLRFLDMGGHEIYHNTYQLALKDSCIPVVVVNLKQYNTLSKESSPIEAVRTLFFDWMAHIFVSNPDVDIPQVVFTHRDNFTAEECSQLVQNFLTSTEELRKMLVEEERHIDGACAKIKQFGGPIITKESIYLIGNELTYDLDTATLDKLLDVLKVLCSRFIRDIPQVWEVVDLKLQSYGGAFLLFEDFLCELKQWCHMEEKQLTVILEYLHDSGKILWFSDRPELRPYIFHKIFQVSRLLNVIFDEYSSEMWKKRLSSFTPFHTLNKHRVEKEEFEAMCNVCDDTGLMNEALLQHLIRTESALSSLSEVSAGLAILQNFNLIHGPVAYRGNQCYILPYFARGFFDASSQIKAHDLSFRAELSFKGLAPPPYLYNTTSLSSLLQYGGDTETFSIRSNGVHVYHNDIDITLIHDSKAQKSVVEVTADPEHTAQMWTLLRQQVAVLTRAAETWVTGRYVVTVFCSHCLLKGDQNPSKEINPKWLSATASPKMRSRYMMCKGDRKVPSCLKMPCSNLTEADIDSLRHYIEECVSNPIIHPAVDPPAGGDTENTYNMIKEFTPTPHVESKDEAENPADMDMEGIEGAETEPATEHHIAVTNRTRSDSIVSTDGEGYLSPSLEDKDLHEIRLRAAPTTESAIKCLYDDSVEVYKMSPGKRGRALIINIENFYGVNALQLRRKGSDIDVKNVKYMLKSLDFELADVQENLTAQEILDAIKRETEHPHHGDFSMFFLCLMSHGSEDEVILGSDQMGVKLKDIYNLLSSSNFSGMAGKPKVVVVQACAGVGVDHGDATSKKLAVGQLIKPTILQVPAALPTSPIAAPLKISHLNPADLLIIKSSFESYISIRCDVRGSLLIRCLVTTLLKHACHRDLFSLFEIVQERVSKISTELAEKYPNTCTGQTAVPIKTFTGGRKLYLFPGHHPRS